MYAYWLANCDGQQLSQTESNIHTYTITVSLWVAAIHNWLTSCDLVRERVPEEGPVSFLHARRGSEGEKG